MKATSPTGSAIVGTLERVPACAKTRDDGFARAPDGTLTYDHVGETKLWWDDQFTVRRGGRVVFVDEHGAEWTAAEITLVAEEDAADG